MNVAIVIRLSAFGDVLLTGPAVRALAATHRVVFVTDAAYAPLVAALPGIAEVRTLDRQLGLGGARQLGLELRALSPTVVLDLQNKVRTQLLARTIGAPVRTLARRTWGQSVSAIFGQDTVLNDEHQSRRYLKACVDETSAPLTLGPLQLDPAWVAAAELAATQAGWSAAPIAIAPAATHATKGWPIDRYAEVLRHLAPQSSPLLLVAGPRDTEAVATFRKALGDWPQLLDASTLPLTTLAALIARCRLLVGNDSGPIHLAKALGVPTVAVFGPTSARRWGPVPGDDRNRVARLELPCSPCSNHGGPRCPLGHHDCMLKLPVGTVEREALVALGR